MPKSTNLNDTGQGRGGPAMQLGLVLPLSAPAAPRPTGRTRTMTFANRLEKIGACSEAVEWLGRRGPTKAWRECERADWILWLFGRMLGKPGWPSRKAIVLAACDCAETALKFIPEGEDRPRMAIETARAWCRGHASLDEVQAAAYAAANAANTANAAAYAYAADAAANTAAYAAANAANATGAAAYAADAAAYTANAANANATRKAALYEMCDIVRARLRPCPVKEIGAH